MITRKLAFVFLGLLIAVQVASAKECLLSHATYREPRSGAVMQFRPLANEPAALTADVFSLIVPNTKTSLPADITWTNGRNSFPLGTIRHACTDDDREAGAGGWQRSLPDMDGPGLCLDRRRRRAVELARSDTGAERAVTARFRRNLHRVCRFRQRQSGWLGMGRLHFDRMQQ
ncbi:MULTISPECIES: hypothetical protein [unclassified Mesorhizobium]|uniref:hypothetical protein n=1 Tax=unclassified Mesorhizobium TaxID=325217 RepID=UPI001FED810A|nr:MULTISPECIES: hypothetical protein [unclassified Mesorhizobium]